MNTYETLFVVNPELEESEINKAIELVQDAITAGGGTVLKIDKWGRRQLAYEIERKREGFYVLLYFQAPAEALPELNRRYKLADAIMRKMILQLRKDQIKELMQEIESGEATVQKEVPEAPESQDDVQDTVEVQEEENTVNSTEDE